MRWFPRPTARAAIALPVAALMAGAGTQLAAQTSDSDTNSILGRGTSDHVHVLRVDYDEDRGAATIIVTIDTGYHINANPASFAYLIPTALHLTRPEAVRVVYPPPVKFKPTYTDDTLDVYEGTIRIEAELAHNELSGHEKLVGTVTAQACTAEVCFPPAVLPLPGE